MATDMPSVNAATRESGFAHMDRGTGSFRSRPLLSGTRPCTQFFL